MAVFKDYYIYVNGQMLFRDVQRDRARTLAVAAAETLTGVQKARRIFTPKADSSQKQWVGLTEPSRCPPPLGAIWGHDTKLAGLCDARGLGKETCWADMEVGGGRGSSGKGLALGLTANKIILGGTGAPWKVRGPWPPSPSCHGEQGEHSLVGGRGWGCPPFLCISRSGEPR